MNKFLFFILSFINRRNKKELFLFDFLYFYLSIRNLERFVICLLIVVLDWKCLRKKVLRISELFWGWGILYSFINVLY